YDFDELHLNFTKSVTRKQKLLLRQKTGMVFQDYNLFPHLTVLQNVTEGPIRVLKQSKEAANQEALEILSKVGLRDFADAYP
ncbi:ATP-binding cassette domain-containing protein, partial [Roseburia faecis]|nr:ATP-binding cassette domain-containing protein [Roseburia faecis]